MSPNIVCRRTTINSKFDNEKFSFESDIASNTSVLSALVLEQHYVDGTVCKTHGVKIKSKVRISCCDPRASYKVKLLDIKEESCRYIVEACSPGLCANHFFKTFELPRKARNLSIRSILNDILSHCLFRSEGWWKYEFW